MQVSHSLFHSRKGRLDLSLDSLYMFIVYIVDSHHSNWFEVLFWVTIVMQRKEMLLAHNVLLAKYQMQVFRKGVEFPLFLYKSNILEMCRSFCLFEMPSRNDSTRRCEQKQELQYRCAETCIFVDIEIVIFSNRHYFTGQGFCTDCGGGYFSSASGIL